MPIGILGYDDSCSVLNAIQNEIDSTKSLVEKSSALKDSMGGEYDCAIQQMETFFSKAEEIADSMKFSERSILNIEEKPWAKTINRLRDEISDASSPILAERLKRELRHMESFHSRELSRLSICQQQLIIEYISLIKNWKLVLSIEIDILEKSSKTIIDRIVIDANSSGDMEVINLVREKLRSLKVIHSAVGNLKLESNVSRVANVRILQEALQKQFIEIAQIEMAIDRKKETLQELSRVQEELEQEAPSKSMKRFRIPNHASAPKMHESEQTPEPENESPQAKTNRMVMRRKI